MRSKVKANNCDTCICTEKLVAICLGAIKEKAIRQLDTSQTTHIEEDRIRWVITVPAIWVCDNQVEKYKADYVSGYSSTQSHAQCSRTSRIPAQKHYHCY